MILFRLAVRVVRRLVVRIAGFPLIVHVGYEAAVPFDVVVDHLEASIGQSHTISSASQLAVKSLMMTVVVVVGRIID